MGMYGYRHMINVEIQLVLMTKGGMDLDVLILSVLLTPIIMEHSVSVLQKISARHGRYLMEFDVYTLREYVQKILNGMEHSVNLFEAVVLLVSMVQVMSVNLFLRNVFIHLIGQMIDV